MTGKTRRARVLRKQDPWSGRFFRVDAIVKLALIISINSWFILHWILLLAQILYTLEAEKNMAGPIKNHTIAPESVGAGFASPKIRKDRDSSFLAHGQRNQANS